MISVSRREWIAGALALWGRTHLSSLSGFQLWAAASGVAGYAEEHSASGNKPASEIPRDYLQSIFTPALLVRSLQAASVWHPYPRCSERKSWLSIPKNIREGLIARADKVVGLSWPVLLASEILEFKRDGNRTRYESIYFDRRGRLVALVLGECLRDDRRYLDSILDGVWLICEESFWGVPAHLGMQHAGVGLPDISDPIVDLFAAETAATLSWIVYLLGDKLATASSLIVPRIKLEAKRRILDPALQRDDFSWMGLLPRRGRLNNWNPWINSNWLTTNLLLEDDPSRRQKAVLKICKSLDQFLEDYSPDGACEEGPVYWQRSAASFFDCCWTLGSVTGGEGDPLSNSFVKKMGHFIADAHIAGNAYVNFGDTHMEDAPTPELIYRFGAADGDKQLQEFGAFSSAQTGLAANGALREKTLTADLGSLSRFLPDILSASEIKSSIKADALSRDSWYSSLQLMTARQESGTSNGFFLAVQAAPNARSHGHNDSGSFIVYHDDRPIFIDVGAEAYTSKTFGPQRYSIWTMQSAFHNLPTVGGVMQSEKPSYRASDVHYWCDQAGAGISFNLATAYPSEAGIKHWLRTVTLDRKLHRVRFVEAFELEHKANVELSFMAQRKPDITSPGRVVLPPTGAGESSVALLYDSSKLKVNLDTIALKDEGLQRYWGAQIYRLRLASSGLVETGNWQLDLCSV